MKEHNCKEKYADYVEIVGLEAISTFVLKINHERTFIKYCPYCGKLLEELK